MNTPDENMENLDICVEDHFGRRDSVGAAIWRILDDVVDSAGLAVYHAVRHEFDTEDAVHDAAQRVRAEVEATIKDYLANNYDDL